MDPDPSTARRALTANIVDPLTLPDWDEQVSALPDATFFHTQAWARVLGSTYAYPCVYVRVSDAAGLVAVLPLMEVDSWMTGRRGVSLPFTDFCGVASASADYRSACLRAAETHALRHRWRALEVRGPVDFATEGASCAFFAHELDLRPELPDLWNACSSSVRRAVRKAEKCPLEVAFSTTPEALEAFCRLHALTRKRHGAPIQPPAFFRSIHEHILEPGRGFIATAAVRGEPIASLMFFLHRGQALFKFGASDTRFQEMRANNLLLWRAICRLKADGCTRLHFGRTSIDNDGLRRFKLGWNTTEERVVYHRFDPRTHEILPSTDQSAGWRSRLFSIVPSPISRLVGSVLYRHFG